MHLKDLCVIITQCLCPHVTDLDPTLAAAVGKGVALLWVELCTRDDLQHSNLSLKPSPLQQAVLPS